MPMPVRRKPSRNHATHLAWLLLLCACPSSEPVAPPSVKATHPLVTLDGEVIVTVEDLEAELRHSPSSPAHKLGQPSKQELLLGLIRAELLAREAHKLGLENDDEVKRQLHKSLVNHYVEARLNKDARANPASEAELKAAYEKRISEFVSPQRLRIQLVEVSAPVPGGAVSPAALNTLADLAARRADAKATAIGDPGWLTSEEMSQRYGPGVARVAAGLKVNQISDPVHGLTAWYLVRLVSKQDATSKSFEQVKPLLQGRLDSDKRAALAQQYAEEADRQSNWKANDAVLNTIDPTKLVEPGEAPPEPAAK